MNDTDEILTESIVNPISSYIALGMVIFFILFILISRLIITADRPNSPDLVLFNTAPKRHLELLVSKQTSSPGAMSNIHAAIACGLMVAPPDYEPPKTKTTK